MRQVGFKIAFVMVAVAMLTACPSQHATRNAVDATNPAPAAVSMAPLQYSWNTNYSAMLSPPMDIREQALAACVERGFGRAYMQSIAINEDQATAYFSCRGSDQ
jgi:uncharacterized lipoprotein YajG